MRKYYLKILFLILLVNSAYSQDAIISSVITPSNGCDLTSSEIIGVVIQNVSGGVIAIPGGSITVKYTVNGSAPIAETLGTFLVNGATWSFNFNIPADLSACETDFDIVTWIDYAADINPNNDTLAWTIRNDCTIIPGRVENDELVCDGDNNQVLNLNGWQYGTIINWTFSEDNGATWLPISNTSTSHTFNNLTTETQFSVEIDGGYCQNDVSAPGVITIQPLPVGGVLDGPSALCASNASGAVSLTGNSAGVLNWESSTDNGGNWTTIGNTTDTENFVGLTETTSYRALIDGGVCQDIYSSTYEVVVDDVSDAGILQTDTLLCTKEALDLVLVGATGTATGWEESTDGVIWNPIAISNPVNNYYTGDLTASTYYRASVVNGVCPSDLSNQVFVEIQSDFLPGTIAGDTSICAANASGTLTLSGNTRGVLKWEKSMDDGLGWIDITNTTAQENYSSLSETTWYRALVDGGACIDKYSDTAFIIVSATTDGGVLATDTSICEGDSYVLDLTGNVGEVISWEMSSDGNLWTVIGGVDSSYTIASVDTSNYYRVNVKNGVCDEDRSNTVFIDVLQNPIADAGADVMIPEGDSVELGGSGGLLGLWSADPTLSDTTIFNPIASPLVTTSYYLTVICADGCFDSDFVTVEVGSPIPAIDVKNVLTPNNDGFNDTWLIVGMEAYSNVAVKVFNIYGTLVFEDDDYQNDWGGEYKGKNLPSGTYLYIVSPEGSEDIFKGDLTILRNE